MSDDPYAIRERTHRYDGIYACRRCGQPYPCPKAGKVDQPARYRWAILAGGLLGLRAAGALLAVVWL
jgi:hypothetical protein